MATMLPQTSKLPFSIRPVSVTSCSSTRSGLATRRDDDAVVEKLGISRLSMIDVGASAYM